MRPVTAAAAAIAGAHQVGAAAGALAALEVAVRGRGATLARRQPVGVHGQAHGAARLAPFEAGLDERPGPGPPPRPACLTSPEPGTIMAPARPPPPCGPRTIGRGLAQVLDAPVGAGADEHLVDPRPRRSSACRPRAPCRRASAPWPVRACRRSARRSRGRAPEPVTGTTSSGLVPQVTWGTISPGGHGRPPCRSAAPGSEGRVAPVGLRLLPGAAALGDDLGLPWSIVEGGLRRARSGRPARPPRPTCCRPSCGASMESSANRLAGVLDDVAGAAGRADLADDRQDQVLGTVVPRGLSSPSTEIRMIAWPASGSGSGSPAHARPLRCRYRRRNSAPKAPCVEVWESPQTMVMPGRVKPCSGPMMWTMPWRDVGHGEVARCRTRRSSGAQGLDLDARSPRRRCRAERSVVGTLWSATARVASRPAHACGRRARSPSKACGLVTSCTRCRSI